MKPKKDFGNLKKNEEFIELGPNESNVRDRGLIVQGLLAYTSKFHYMGYMIWAIYDIYGLYMIYGLYRIFS